MTPSEYMQESARTENTPDFIKNDDSSLAAHVMHGAMGVVTEAGELMDAMKRHLIYSKPLDRTNVIEEVGDQLWYIALVLRSIGSTFEEAMDLNIAKLRVRFPDKFDPERALNHDLVAERAALQGHAEALTRAFEER
jgi:NTP pyrophosphatase (non-canonical NTP hydrolase)